MSVYGLRTINDVVRKIKTKLYPLLYSKGAAVAKKVVYTALQILTKSQVDIDGDETGEELNSLLDAEGFLEIFKSDSLAIKGNKVLVFDDLERSQIPLDEFFGFINSIVEHSNSKVILICDENKLKESADRDNLKVEYKYFKEKLVGQTFSLEVNYTQIVASFIKASGNTILTDNLNLIVDLFVASKCENLRIIKHCLLDIERLFNQLPNEIMKSANYAIFVKNVVAYIVITSIEERFGNKNIDKFQSILGTREDSLEIERKYNPTLECYQLNHSLSTIPISTLLSFVRTGYFENPEDIVARCQLLQSRNINNREKLWRCNTLSNDEFTRLLEEEKEKFYKKQLGYAFEVVHLAGIFLFLEKRGLVKLSRKYIVCMAKVNISAIHKIYPDDISRIMINSQEYFFQENNSEEMKEILSFAELLLQKCTMKVEKEFVINAWEQLRPGMTHGEIGNLFNQFVPTQCCYYSQRSIFMQIESKAMVEKIVALPNATKTEFSYFLMGRYYLQGSGINGNLLEEMKKDKEALIKISNGLKSKARHLKLIDKEQTLIIASKMIEAAAKM